MGIAGDVFYGVVANIVPLLSVVTGAVCHWVIDWEDEALDATGKLRLFTCIDGVGFGVTVAYGASQAFVAVWYALLVAIVLLTNDQTKFQLKDQGGIHTTVKAYDLSNLRYDIITWLVGAGLVVFLHKSSEMNMPLAVQTVITPVQMVMSELFRIHVLRQSARVGALVRPWDQSDRLLNLLNPSQLKKEMKAFTADGPKKDRLNRRNAARLRARGGSNKLPRRR